MRTLIYAAALAGLLVPGGFVGLASAADLEPYYEPEPAPPPPPPVAVLPPPQAPLVVAVRPPCGFYRPCLRPYARFGFYGPRPYRFGRPAYAYEKPAYAPIAREGYGYDYDRDRFERAHEHFSHYGYGPNERPRAEPYERRYERRERADRYDGGRPYADPLGHGDVDRRRGERFGGYDRPEGDRFDRGPARYDRRPGLDDQG